MSLPTKILRKFIKKLKCNCYTCQKNFNHRNIYFIYILIRVVTSRTKIQLKAHYF